MGMTWPCTVDYSYGRPGTAAIVNYGAVGAMRYLGNDGRCIYPAERDQLLGAGLGIGLIWETTARRPADSGWNGGVEDAHRANAEADELGAPGNTPIFYAVDFQPTTSELNGPVSDYFHGAMTVGGRNVRAYGCASVMQRLCGDLALFPDSWQCAAWSYPGTAPGTPIYEGGYNLVLSPYASMLQNIGYVLGDTSDHNSLITADVSWMWGLEGSGDWFDMATKDELREVVNDCLNEKLAQYYTGQRTVSVPGDPRIYEVLRDGGEVVRRYIPSPDQIKMLRYIDGLAEPDAFGDPRQITDPGMISAFNDLPCVGPVDDAD